MSRKPVKVLSFLVIAALFLTAALSPASAAPGAENVRRIAPPSPEAAWAHKVDGIMKYLGLDRTTVYKIILAGMQKVPPVVSSAGSLTSARLSILDEFLKPQMDEAVLRKHASAVISSFDDMTRAVHDLALTVKGHLTPEQQEKIFMGMVFKAATSVKGARRSAPRGKGVKIVKKTRKKVYSFVKKLGLSPEQKAAMKADLLSAMPGMVEAGSKVLSLMIGCGAEMLKPDCNRDALEKRGRKSSPQ